MTAPDETKQNHGRRVAVPSFAPGGLEAERSGHFGHCDLFTLVSVSDKEVLAVEVVANKPHHEGGCLDPVNMLADLGVTDIIVGGMGARPLAYFQELDINVFADQQLPLVGQAIDALLDDRVAPMTLDHVCGGGTCH
jgi:predicted Fe-Mo cluster-binding NifX family protein